MLLLRTLCSYESARCPTDTKHPYASFLARNTHYIPLLLPPNFPHGTRSPQPLHPDTGCTPPPGSSALPSCPSHLHYLKTWGAPSPALFTSHSLLESHRWICPLGKATWKYLSKLARHTHFALTILLPEFAIYLLCMGHTRAQRNFTKIFIETHSM